MKQNIICLKDNIWVLFFERGKHNTIMVGKSMVFDESFIEVERSTLSGIELIDAIDNCKIKFAQMVEGKVYYIDNKEIGNIVLKNNKTISEVVNKQKYILWKSSKLASYIKRIEDDRSIKIKNQFLGLCKAYEDKEATCDKEYKKEIVEDSNSSVDDINVKEDKYKYEAVATIYDINDKLIGYRLKELSNGKLHDLFTLKVEGLAEQRKISNIEYVVTSTGKNYLRGNGITIENLSKIYNA